jgi:hypothetical protein
MRKMKSSTFIKYHRWKKVIPFFQYKPLILTLELETLDEEEERGRYNDARPPEIRTIEEELIDSSGGRDSS